MSTFRIRPCVQCGYCCTKSACPFGTWDEAKQRCAHLTEDMLCGRYAEITSSAYHTLAEMAPAFGAGCCMPLFNTWREAKLRGLPRPV